MVLECPECDGEIDVGDEWSALMKSEPITCPKCETRLRLDYEEYYDSDSGDDFYTFSFERIER